MRLSFGNSDKKMILPVKKIVEKKFSMSEAQVLARM
jgi:hypothetical protein